MMQIVQSARGASPATVSVRCSEALICEAINNGEDRLAVKFVAAIRLAAAALVFRVNNDQLLECDHKVLGYASDICEDGLITRMKTINQQIGRLTNMDKNGERYYRYSNMAIISANYFRVAVSLAASTANSKYAEVLHENGPYGFLDIF